MAETETMREPGSASAQWEKPPPAPAQVTERTKAPDKKEWERFVTPTVARIALGPKYYNPGFTEEVTPDEIKIALERTEPDYNAVNSLSNDHRGEYARDNGLTFEQHMTKYRKGIESYIQRSSNAPEDDPLREERLKALTALGNNSTQVNEAGKQFSQVLYDRYCKDGTNIGKFVKDLADGCRIGKATWKSHSSENPVEVTGYAGRDKDGKEYVTAKDKDGEYHLPVDEIVFSDDDEKVFDLDKLKTRLDSIAELRGVFFNKDSTEKLIDDFAMAQGVLSQTAESKEELKSVLKNNFEIELEGDDKIRMQKLWEQLDILVQREAARAKKTAQPAEPDVNATNPDGTLTDERKQQIKSIIEQATTSPFSTKEKHELHHFIKKYENGETLDTSETQRFQELKKRLPRFKSLSEFESALELAGISEDKRQDIINKEKNKVVPVDKEKTYILIPTQEGRLFYKRVKFLPDTILVDKTSTGNTENPTQTSTITPEANNEPPVPVKAEVGMKVILADTGAEWGIIDSITAEGMARVKMPDGAYIDLPLNTLESEWSHYKIENPPTEITGSEQEEHNADLSAAKTVKNEKDEPNNAIAPLTDEAKDEIKRIIDNAKTNPLSPDEFKELIRLSTKDDLEGLSDEDESNRLDELVAKQNIVTYTLNEYKFALSCAGKRDEEIQKILAEEHVEDITNEEQVIHVLGFRRSEDDKVILSHQTLVVNKSDIEREQEENPKRGDTEEIPTLALGQEIIQRDAGGERGVWKIDSVYKPLDKLEKYSLRNLSTGARTTKSKKELHEDIQTPGSPWRLSDQPAPTPEQVFEYRRTHP